MRKMLLKGLSGILRVKDDEQFISNCVSSCVEGLDELIIIYHECNDVCVAEILKAKNKYPEKIKVYEYTHKICAHNLTKEEFDRVVKLPLDSPELLSSYYNFGLSKVNYQYAVKIDADQLYFTEELKRYKELINNDSFRCKLYDLFLGKSVYNLFRIERKISLILNKKIRFVPDILFKKCKSSYLNYICSEFKKDKMALSISGVNVYKNGVDWEITLGKYDNNFNILPPFNGENDHLIFKVSKDTYFKPYAFDYYNKLRSCQYSVIEQFVHPYQIGNVGFAWFHLNSLRNSYKDKIKKAHINSPKAFMNLEEFVNLNFYKIDQLADNKMFTLYQRIIMNFLYIIDRDTIKNNKKLLYSYDPS